MMMMMMMMMMIMEWMGPCFLDKFRWASLVDHWFRDREDIWGACVGVFLRCRMFCLLGFCRKYVVFRFLGWKASWRGGSSTVSTSSKLHLADIEIEAKSRKSEEDRGKMEDQTLSMVSPSRACRAEPPLPTVKCTTLLSRLSMAYVQLHVILSELYGEPSALSVMIDFYDVSSAAFDVLFATLCFIMLCVDSCSVFGVRMFVHDVPRRLWLEILHTDSWAHSMMLFI